MLLGGLLLFGAQNAMATDYLKGSWNWDTGQVEFVYTDGVGTATIHLAADSEYSFGIQNGKNWKSNSGIISANVTNWEFSATSGNCTLRTDAEGDYTFTIVWSEISSDNWQPLLSVSFPDGAGTYTISYINVKSWSNVYAYAYSGDGEASFPTKKEQLGAWPGTPVSEEGGLYTVTFSRNNEPDHVIFNNGNSGDGNQSWNMDFINYAIYKYDGIQTYSLTPTALSDNNYATFYGSYNVKLPSGVDAYIGELAGSTLTLYPFNSDVVPASTPVILKASTVSGFEVTATTAEAGMASGTNSLAGKETETAMSSMTAEIGDGTLCVLGVNGASVGFYRFTGENLAANRAYLIVPGAGAAPAIHFAFDEATDIMAVKENETVVKFIENGKLFIQKNGVVYDMTGRIVK